MQQPDFTSLFYQSLGGTPRAVRYALREGPNLLHDLAFLSSLVHDARLQPARLRGVEGQVEIPINRDCWELGLTEKQNTSELRIANARLVLTGAGEPRWRPMPRDAEVWIDYLWVSEQVRQHDAESFDLIIAGHGWRLVIPLLKAAWAVTLEDLGIPTCFQSGP